MKGIKIGESFLEMTVGNITKQETGAIVNAANKRKYNILDCIQEDNR